MTTQQTSPSVTDDIRFEAPHLDDGKEMWRMAHSSKKLDANSSYFYVLWCRDFASTSVVARSEGEVCGFIVGFARPDDPQTLFVWQTAVDQSHQGNGLACRMLDHLAGDRYRYVEATVTSDNVASHGFLTSFARSRGVEVTHTPLLGSELFPPGHAPESLIRIGPLAG